jgi:hypothetical protein
MKYLKLFESGDFSLDELPTIEEIKSNIKIMMNDNKYFRRYEPYAKKDEQCKRLMMIMCHQRKFLTNGISNNVINNIPHYVTQIIGQKTINQKIDEAIDNVLDTFNKSIINLLKTAFIELILEYVGDKSKKRNKDENVQVYLEWIDKKRNCIPEWARNIPELKYLYRSKNTGLLDINKR